MMCIVHLDHSRSRYGNFYDLLECFPERENNSPDSA